VNSSKLAKEAHYAFLFQDIPAEAR